MCQALAIRLGTVQGAGLHRCADGSAVNPLVAELGAFQSSGRTGGGRWGGEETGAVTVYQVLWNYFNILTVITPLLQLDVNSHYPHLTNFSLCLISPLILFLLVTFLI